MNDPERQAAPEYKTSLPRDAPQPGYRDRLSHAQHVQAVVSAKVAKSNKAHPSKTALGRGVVAADPIGIRLPYFSSAEHFVYCFMHGAANAVRDLWNLMSGDPKKSKFLTEQRRFVFVPRVSIIREWLNCAPL